ncbi:sulfotransferase [uncultured Tateyamaria sp.]|uniref:sulfotransferase family protein n=1 Tax=Tateyamaria sp. 1078 TaxID=3417464 RepID=UPI0026374F50|nr:sulfotransferase [uncultured Tateyamaria sp.]
MTAPLLPHFIIIGAMKSGTTTLYRDLALHPDVDMSRDKETDFFVAEKNWSQGRDWYGAQFSRPDAVRGEASPNYTKSRDFPGVPARMADICPDAKLIYILRDPVARAQSQFSHSVVMGSLSPNLDGFEDSHEYAHILDGSLYAKQLEGYLEHFPLEAILILDFDDLVRDPQAVMNQITDHIGVARHVLDAHGAKNDSAEISKVPAPILRFAQSPVGRRIAGLISRDMRDRIRGALALSKSRKPPAFPDALRARIEADVRADANRLRQITGKPYSNWSV